MRYKCVDEYRAWGHYDTILLETDDLEELCTFVQGKKKKDGKFVVFDGPSLAVHFNSVIGKRSLNVEHMPTERVCDYIKDYAKELFDFCSLDLDLVKFLNDELYPKIRERKQHLHISSSDLDVLKHISMLLDVYLINYSEYKEEYFRDISAEELHTDILNVRCGVMLVPKISVHELDVLNKMLIMRYPKSYDRPIVIGLSME